MTTLELDRMEDLTRSALETFKSQGSSGSARPQKKVRLELAKLAAPE